MISYLLHNFQILLLLNEQLLGIYENYIQIFWPSLVFELYQTRFLSLIYKTKFTCLRQ